MENVPLTRKGEGGKMLGMGKLSVDFKLAGRSIPEIRERFDRALIDQNKRLAVGHGRRKRMSNETMVNAAMLHFLELAPEEQTRILAEYVPRYLGMLAAGDDAPAPLIGQPTDLKPARPARKGKSA